MKKHLNTLAGLLSLLVSNQSFGWILTITWDKEAAGDYKSKYLKSDYYINSINHTSLKRASFAGNVDQPFTKDVQNDSFDDLYVKGAPKASIGPRSIKFTTRKDSNGKIINPIKGLTVKRVDGKTVIVENQ